MRSCERGRRVNWVRCDTFEPRHEKMYLREFLTRPDTNEPAQPQKLARILKVRI